LGVWAHPDDESLNIEEILALANKAKINTQIICLMEKWAYLKIVP